MPHSICSGSPVGLMAQGDVVVMKKSVIAAMAGVENCGFEGRQVRLAIPIETVISHGTLEYKPVFHASFAFEKNRPEEKLAEVCTAAAEILMHCFKDFGVKEVQYTWDVDFGGRFGRYPAKDSQ